MPTAELGSFDTVSTIGADLRAEPLETTAAGTRFLLHYGSGTLEMTTPPAGRHNIYNSLAAAGAMLAVGLDLETIRAGLATVRASPAASNASASKVPASTSSSITPTPTTPSTTCSAAVRPLTSGRLWCVFGCGGDRDRTKRPRMAAVAARLADPSSSRATIPAPSRPQVDHR